MSRIDVMKRPVPRRCLIVVVGLITTSSFLFAQERSTDSQTNEVAPEFASAFVPRGSWLHDTLRKLHALYLLPAQFDPSSISITQREAGRMLLRSIEKARHTPPIAPITLIGYRSAKNPNIIMLNMTVKGSSATPNAIA